MSSDGVRRTDYAYQSIATCEGPDNWVHEASDGALRRAARLHVRLTGHRVNIDWARATVYEREPHSPAARKMQGG